MSQIEVRDRTAAFGNIDLSEFACEVAELFDAAAEEKGIKLWVSGKEAVSVRGDRDLLFDAVSNLIDNAIKHGSNPGEVHIAVGESRDAALLDVADRGPGIPAEERSMFCVAFIASSAAEAVRATASVSVSLPLT